MEDELNLYEFWGILKRRKRTIILFAVVFGALALILAFLQSPVYEAKTTILLRNGTAGGFSQFAGLARFAGINLSSSNSDIYEMINLLNSRTVAAKVIEDLKLRERVEGWDNPNLGNQRLLDIFQRMIIIPSDPENNLLVIGVYFNDPEMAAEIANHYVEVLSLYANKLSYTEARSKREYIEKQLPKVEQKLKAAEQNLKKFTLLSPRGGASSSGLLGMVNGNRSGGVEIDRLTRELEIQDAVYTMLRKEYETVKLEEAKEIPPFSVVDKAAVPERPIKPKKITNTLMGIFVGIFLGSFRAFFKEQASKNLKKD